ncbi:hypothetical protein [Serinicoccus hydrothermalis]|nr:hypothetical protein [Serinicoccus hydrothermalis]
MAASEALTYSKYPNDPLYATLAQQWTEIYEKLAKAGKETK